jgi:hypothetical protein
LFSPLLFGKAQSMPPAKSKTLPSSPIKFKETVPLSISWKQLLQGQSTLEVKNETINSLKAKLVLTDFKFTDTNNKPIQTSEVLKLAIISDLISGKTVIEQGHIFFAPSQTALISLLPVSTNLQLKTGKYEGTISINTVEKNSAIQRSIQITVEKNAVQPLVNELTVTCYRWLPFFKLAWSTESTLPLQVSGNSDEIDFLENQILGGLHRDKGGVAIVRSGELSNTKTSSLASLNLKIEGLEHAGSYKGDILLNTDPNTKDKVGLTVNYKDTLILPVIVLALGIWLGLIAKRYAGVWRPILELRAQEAELGERFNSSQKIFKEKINDPSFSIEEDLKKQQQELLTQISTLHTINSLLLDPNDANYKAIRDRLTSLQSDVDKWSGFADKLLLLKKTLSDAKGDGEALKKAVNLDLSGSPEVVQTLDSLLTGKVLTIAEFRDHYAQRNMKRSPLW